MTRGVWFVFPMDDGTVVRAWGSCLSGTERVWMDDTMVSEDESLTKSNVHKFESDGEQYVVRFDTVSALRGCLGCSLSRNGKVVQEATARYKFVDAGWIKSLTIVVLASYAIRAIQLGLGLPTIATIGAIFVLLAVVAVGHGGSFEVE